MKLSKQLLWDIRKEHKEKLNKGDQIVLKVTETQLWEWSESIMITSSEYVTILSLAKGDIDVAFGFKFEVIKSDEIVEIDLIPKQ